MEVSSMLIEMGQALMVEGDEARDGSLSKIGTFVILLGGVLMDENDIEEFGMLCSMFSAKKVLDSMESKKILADILKDKDKDESYDDFIKKLNKMRKKNGDNPL